MTYSFIGLADTIPRMPNPTILSTGTSPANNKAIKGNNKDRNHKVSRLQREDTTSINMKKMHKER